MREVAGSSPAPPIHAINRKERPMAQVDARQQVPVLLQAARDLFAATHWGKGAFAYWEEDEGKPGQPKQKFCAIGGLREKSGHEPEQGDEEELLEDAAYAGALYALVETLAEEHSTIRDRVALYGNDRRSLREQIEDPLDVWEQRASLELCQDIIVSWNDN